MRTDKRDDFINNITVIQNTAYDAWQTLSFKQIQELEKWKEDAWRILNRRKK